MENSKIEWTDHTFNPWEGCTKVSDGCKNCYAEARAKRFGTVQWGPQGKRRRTSAANWKKPLKWNREAKEKGIRYRVFCASLADVFEDKPDQPEIAEWRGDLFELIKETPNLDWLLLTKRPDNVRKAWHWELMGYPENVWIGTSVENQEQADKRIPELLNIPAKVMFLSMEPLLGSVDISRYLGSGINWVIVGGESGKHARPMNPEWVRTIRDQCVEAGVPFLFKQWGKWLPFGQDAEGDDGTWSPPGKLANISGHVFQGIGKKLSGRLLDDRPWNQFPSITGDVWRKQ